MCRKKQKCIWIYRLNELRLVMFPHTLEISFALLSVWNLFSFAKTYGATTFGIDGRIIDVEVDVSPGLPGFELVGLPDTSVKESKERVTVHLA